MENGIRNIKMDKNAYLEQLKQQNCIDKAAEQATSTYWQESQFVNEVFQLWENDQTIPLDLYISWRDLHAKCWGDLCTRLKMDLKAKRFLTAFYSSEEEGLFDEVLWLSTLNECMSDASCRSSDYTSVVFTYQLLKNQQEIDSKIGPIKGLLTELEQIVGSECFNINKAEPWKRWRVLEPTCERLRYPITFELADDEVIKTRHVPDNISNLDFISGKYVLVQTS